MHQTTLRFPQDLWSFLEQEAKGLGVSVAQYVREAALARAAYDAGKRGEPMFVDQGMLPQTAEPESTEGRADVAIAGARDKMTDASAVWAQARLARRRSEQLRAQAYEYQHRTQEQRP
jgi:hypothetical protein